MCKKDSPDYNLKNAARPPRTARCGYDHRNFAMYPRWHICAHVARARPYEPAHVVRPQRRDAQQQHTTIAAQQPAQQYDAEPPRAPRHKRRATKAGITTHRHLPTRRASPVLPSVDISQHQGPLPQQEPQQVPISTAVATAAIETDPHSTIATTSPSTRLHRHHHRRRQPPSPSSPSSPPSPPPRHAYHHQLRGLLTRCPTLWRANLSYIRHHHRSSGAAGRVE